MDVLTTTSQPGPGSLVCCAACRRLGKPGDTDRCAGCGEPGLITLARGLASLEVDGQAGLLRYDGERVMVVLAVGLLLLFPAAAIVDLAGGDALGPALLGLCLVGIPVLALADARRAGAAVCARERGLADISPDPLQLGADAALIIRGAAMRIDGPISGPSSDPFSDPILGPITGPISGLGCLALRLDVRAGREAAILARHVDAAELLVTGDDGTQVLITGTIEIAADTYTEAASAGDIRYAPDGVRLLPVRCDEGAWACEVAVRHGDRIEVMGSDAALGHEMRVHPLGALYRSAGMIPVLRGAPGRPVIIRLARDRLPN